MNIKGVCIRYNPDKAPIRKFVVSLELDGEHPQSIEEIFSKAKPLIVKAIGWLLLSLIGFARPELDQNKA